MKKNKFLQIFFSVYNHLHNGFKTLSKNVWLDAPWLKKLRAPGQTVKKNESGPRAVNVEVTLVNITFSVSFVMNSEI